MMKNLERKPSAVIKKPRKTENEEKEGLDVSVCSVEKSDELFKTVTCVTERSQEGHDQEAALKSAKDEFATAAKSKNAGTSLRNTSINKPRNPKKREQVDMGKDFTKEGHHSQEVHDKMQKEAALKGAMATAVAESKGRSLRGKENEKKVLPPILPSEATAIPTDVS